jgi:hypothetical protein
MRNFVVFLGLAGVLAMTAAAADPVAPGTTSATPAAAPAQPPVASDDPNRMVCRTLEAKTGSRIGGRRECRTQREWDDIRQQNQHELEKMQARDSLGPR